MYYLQGDIYLADLGDGIHTTGSEQQGIRPVCIVSNNIGNKYSDTLIVAPLTTKQKNLHQLTKVCIEKDECNITKDSVILCEQLTTISKNRILRWIGHLTPSLMQELMSALHVALNLE